jgi:hypothetical protein
MNKYVLALYVPPDQEPDWKEVTLVEFQQAERNAGFRNKGGGPTATSGFVGGGVMGSVLYEPASNILSKMYGSSKKGGTNVS